MFMMVAVRTSGLYFGAGELERTKGLLAGTADDLTSSHLARPDNIPNYARPPQRGVTRCRMRRRSRVPRTENEDDENDPNQGDMACGGFDGKMVYITNVKNGLPLSNCSGCGKATTPMSVTTHGTKGAVKWKIMKYQGKCLLIQGGDLGKGSLASRCNGCWTRAGSLDAVFLHLKQPGQFSMWDMEMKDGHFTFKGDNGKYMTVCPGCVPGTSTPNIVSVTASQPNEAAMWDVEEA